MIRVTSIDDQLLINNSNKNAEFYLKERSKWGALDGKIVFYYYEDSGTEGIFTYVSKFSALPSEFSTPKENSVQDLLLSLTNLTNIALTSIPEIVTVNPVSAPSNDLIASFEASKYKFISLQLTGTWVGTVSFQGSNDNGEFIDVVSQNAGEKKVPYVDSISVNSGVKIPVLFKYLRVRVTAYTSGTVEGVAFGYREDSNTGQISALGEVSIAAGTEEIGSVKVLPPISTSPLYTKFISTTGAVLGLNATLVQSGFSNLGILHIFNIAATPRYFKLYNKASAPSVGVDIPMITIALAGASTSSFVLPALVGIDFSVGLSFAITLGVSDSDATPFTVSGEVSGMIAYT